MKGKHIIVTGANSGIGKATATALARMGATLTLMCRSEERGATALTEIRQESGNDAVDLVLLDLGELDAIERAAETFRARHGRLDALVNNAGVYLGSRQETADGFEATMGVNHIGTFLLTVRLLDLLEAAPAGRIVTVSSEAHRAGSLNFGDPFYEQRRYIALGAYSDSKLANVLFANELARRLAGTGVTSNSLHPGMIDTNLSVGEGWFGIVARMSSPFLATPEKGARTSIYLASSPAVDGVTGEYFVRRRRKKPARAARDPELAARLWRWTEDVLRDHGHEV